MTRLSKLFSTTMVFALLAGSALSFWQTGHLLVAKIAFDKLAKENPKALQAANQLLEVYRKTNPELTKLENSYPFVECATFADEIKSKGGTWQSNWHFIDTPYFDQGGEAKDFPLFKFDVEHIGLVIPAIIDWLSNTGNYQETFVYKTMKKQIPNEEDAKSYALRLLIHYIGDIHQPLHASARVNPQYPKGDAGGNFFKVPVLENTKNLHSVWDSAVYAYTDTPKLPFDVNTWKAISIKSQDLCSKFNFNKSRYSSADVNIWSQESYEITKSNVYSFGAKEDQPLSAEYVKTNQDLIKQQIVLGGYRLAYTISQIYGGAQNLSSSINEDLIESEINLNENISFLA